MINTSLEKNKEKDNIQVIVRVRPLNEREIMSGARSCLLIEEEKNKLILECKPDPKTFVYDYIAGEKNNQNDVFQNVGKQLTNSCLEGYNVCIFAYGQTGSGKTYTMQGKGFTNDGCDTNHKGLQPRVIDYLFHLMNGLKKTEDFEFLIKCNYLEIYNEQIVDLLSNTNNTLQVREDMRKGPYVEGLTEEIAPNAEKMLEIFRKGMRNRHIGATSMNMESSRSHSLFTIVVESKQTINKIQQIKTSKLNFVDLAGSERQKQSQVAGERLKEAGNINKSLTLLGLVINSLVENSQGKNRHVPYRDSKLTFILRDSLGGNSRTCMIANVTCASTSFAETLSTLKFAQRAKLIKNKALINVEAEGNMESLKAEIRRLKYELNKFKENIVDQSTLENLMRESLNQSFEDRRLILDFIEKNQKNVMEEELDKNNTSFCILSESLKKSMEEKNNMEQSIQELEMNLEHEKNKNEVLENEKKKMQEEFEIFTISQNFEASEKNEKIAKMQQKIDFLEGQNLELIQENTKNKTRLETMNLQLKSFDDFNSALKLTIQEKEYLFSENKSLQDRILLSEQTLSSLKSELNLKSYQLTELTSTNIDYKNLTAELKEEIERKNKKLFENESRVNENLARINELEKSELEIKFELNSKIQHILDENKNFIDEVNLKETSYLNKIEELSIHLGEYNNIISQQNADIERLEFKNTDANRKLEYSSFELKQKENETFYLKEENKKVNEFIQNLEKELKIEKEAKKNSEDFLEIVLNDKKRTELEKEQYQLELNKLSNDYEGLSEEHRMICEDLEKMGKEKKELVQKIGRLDIESEEKSKIIDQQQKQNDLEIQKLNDALGLIKEKIRDKDKKIDHLLKENQNKEEQIKSTVIQLKEVLEQHQDMFKEIEEINRLREDNKYMSEKFESLSDEVESFRNENKILNEKNDQMSYNLRVITTNYKLKETELSNLAEERNISEIVKQKLEKENSSLNALVFSLKKENHTLNEEMKKMNTENTMLLAIENLDPNIPTNENNNKNREETRLLREENQRQKEMVGNLKTKIEDLSKKLRLNPKKIIEESNEMLKLKRELQNSSNKNLSLQQTFDNIHEMLEEFFGNSAIYMKNDSTIEMTEVTFAERLKEFIQTLKLRESILLDREMNIRLNDSKNSLLKKENEFLKQKLKSANIENVQIESQPHNYNLGFFEPQSEKIISRARNFIEEISLTPKKKLKLN